MRHSIQVLLMLAVLCCVLLSGFGCGNSATKTEKAPQDDVQALLDKDIRPNEMGQVMIWEYHQIDESGARWSQTPGSFRKDLEALYEKGYSLISLDDLVSGKIDVPAGRTPIVFTFDDSDASQFRYEKKNDELIIDPECAIGIMEDFAKEHPAFGCTATFFVLPPPFRQEKYAEKKVRYLVENGYTIGNHTYSHVSLAKVSDEEAQEELAKPVKYIKDISPDATMEFLALPYGDIPKNEALLFHGSHGDAEYENKAVLLVGSGPTLPPYHYNGKSDYLPRVQSIYGEDNERSFGTKYWLDCFDRNPELRFISDGNPDTICAPSYMRRRLTSDKSSENNFVGY